MFIGIAIFFVVSAVFLAAISRKDSSIKPKSDTTIKTHEMLYSPESGHKNAIRIITICAVFGFIGGAIIRFSLVEQDFTEKSGLYVNLALEKEQIAAVLKNQKVAGGMWLSTLAVCLIVKAFLEKREYVHPRHVGSLLILIPGFFIGLLIISIIPDAIPKGANISTVKEISDRYFLTGIAVMTAALFASWFCWNAAEKQLKNESNDQGQ